MDRRHFLAAGTVGLSALASAPTTAAAAPGSAPAATAPGPSSQAVPRGPAEQLRCDTLVYGSTPGGIAAAIEAARRGDRVLLACPERRPGGMAASGLSTTDAVRRELFTGLVAEFVAGIRAAYGRILPPGSPEAALTRDGWFYEPSVAERVFRQLLEREADRLEWRPGCWLVSAQVSEALVRGVMFEADGQLLQVVARTYIDGTYEGDLAAAAGVDYRVGREGREEYGEPFAGIHYMNHRTGQQIVTADTGEPSMAIQAFCLRSIFTDDPAHRVPIEKPETYEEHLGDLLPLIDDFRTRRHAMGARHAAAASQIQMNGNIAALTSINCPGINWGYPEAGRHHRQRLDRFHRDHVASLLWFLQHDRRVPEQIRAGLAPLGLHDQEFTDTEHWPWQLYVRQGRRIRGRALVTQHNFLIDDRTGRTPPVEQPIAVGEHSFDVHPCHDRRFAVDGFMEGVLWYPQKALGPAQPGQIPYGAMLPRRVDNLLVPVALSSTHVAMSVLRMEPVWMTTGQIAGLAAATAREQRLQVAQLDPMPLPGRLGITTDPYAEP